MRSEATTVDEYLEELPEDRREAIVSVRRVILDNLSEGFEEAMNWGMITYQLPLERSGPTYNGQPLMLAAIASQKNHMAVYLTSVYSDPDALEHFRSAYLATGKKLDMGKSCVRFKRLDDLPLEVIGQAVCDVDVESFLGLMSRTS